MKIRYLWYQVCQHPGDEVLAGENGGNLRHEALHGADGDPGILLQPIVTSSMASTIGQGCNYQGSIFLQSITIDI